MPVYQACGQGKHAGLFAVRLACRASLAPRVLLASPLFRSFLQGSLRPCSFRVPPVPCTRVFVLARGWATPRAARPPRLVVFVLARGWAYLEAADEGSWERFCARARMGDRIDRLCDLDGLSPAHRPAQRPSKKAFPRPSALLAHPPHQFFVNDASFPSHGTCMCDNLAVGVLFWAQAGPVEEPRGQGTWRGGGRT